MTLSDIYTLLYDHKALVLLVLLVAPWLALGVCIAIPGTREEPFILNFNLSMAVLSLLLAVGYLWYAAHTAGIANIVQQADILLVLAPFYYVGVSVWVTQQRLPLMQIPVARIVQGAALIGAGYFGLAWLFSKLQIFVLTFVPFQLLVMVLLGLIGLAYMGYLQITGAAFKGDRNRSSAGTPAAPQNRSQRRSESRQKNAPSEETSIDEELESLRRRLEDDDS
jgi:hypothetical protein